VPAYKAIKIFSLLGYDFVKIVANFPEHPAASILSTEHFRTNHKTIQIFAVLKALILILEH
jgi:hypothetical protein